MAPYDAAFPHQPGAGMDSCGMSKREYYAGLFVAAAITGEYTKNGEFPEDAEATSLQAKAFADALVTVLNA